MRSACRTPRGRRTAGRPEAAEFKDRPLPRGDEAARDLSLATQRLGGMEDIVISGVQLSADYGRITVFDLPNSPGNCSKVFQAVATSGIMVDTIVQNLNGPNLAELSFTRAQERPAPGVDPDPGRAARNQSARKSGGRLRHRRALRVRRRHADAHGRGPQDVRALAEKGINITMITTSEVCVSVVVELRRGRGSVGVPEEGVRRGMKSVKSEPGE